MFAYSSEIAILPEISLNPRSILAENRSAVYNTIASRRQFYNPLLSLTIFEEYFILSRSYLSRVEKKYRERIKKTNYLYGIRNAISIWRYCPSYDMFDIIPFVVEYSWSNREARGIAISPLKKKYGARRPPWSHDCRKAYRDDGERYCQYVRISMYEIHSRNVWQTPSRWFVISAS